MNGSEGWEDDVAQKFNQAKTVAIAGDKWRVVDTDPQIGYVDVTLTRNGMEVPAEVHYGNNSDCYDIELFVSDSRWNDIDIGVEKP